MREHIHLENNSLKYDLFIYLEYQNFEIYAIKAKGSDGFHVPK